MGLWSQSQEPQEHLPARRLPPAPGSPISPSRPSGTSPTTRVLGMQFSCFLTSPAACKRIGLYHFPANTLTTPNHYHYHHHPASQKCWQH